MVKHITLRSSRTNKSLQMPCAYCKPVNTICFWGPRPERPWKRPVLLVLSLILGVGFGSLLWLLQDRPDYVLFFAIGAPFTAVAALSVLVSVKGCSACVARLLGEV
jgi:hypothetical protein